ncbi:hypothetical protein PO878_00205 [Iamia majanohamensis]|uniref:Uncharacterized protein n=1 Tax=Iamia majanohamensis TaxID=467976 RepID=A0AAE9Y5T6_9ACTN|nr:hypothetical protein [Iamia majanohamensis]WCO67144.1 hypothetical protein PO878_00205 [Iamia majanohamensis]
MTDHGSTISINSSTLAEAVPDPSGQGEPGDLNDALIATDIWTDQMLADAGIPVYDVPLVSVGGGIGSFILADFLRIAGMPANQMRILTNLDVPWQTYEYLTRMSQIPRGERLRSDSQSMPDNIWGFPSYAFREAWTDKTIAPVANVLTEPILNDYWTPRAGQVFESMEREAARIGYWGMVSQGQVRMTRRRYGGGYFTILTPPAGTTTTKRVAFRSTYVHLCVGYPGVAFLPDLQQYRSTYDDYVRVVNSYEPHEHVYEELKRRPGLVMIRGNGIVASRVLQRLIDDRDAYGLQTQILHLFRTYRTESFGRSIFERRVARNGWIYQGFNWPKSAWGGANKRKFEKLEGEQRAEFYKRLAGTTTPARKDWKEQLARGRREGWYRTYIGTVDTVVPGDDGTIVTRVQAKDGSILEVPAHFIIDATGLEANIREHRLFADLLDHSGAQLNPLGRLDVERHFEIRGTQSGVGTAYAMGSMTLGAYFAGVDTFLGLQYSSLRIADDLAKRGFVKKIGVGRSTSQWWRWARHKPLPGA